MGNGIQIPRGVKPSYRKPFLSGAFEAGIVTLGFGSEGIDLFERNTLAVNGKAVIVGNGNVFCAASVFLAIVPIFVFTRTLCTF